MGLAVGKSLSLAVFGVSISSSGPPLALGHPECLVFIADEFSIRDLCFCQEHGPEPRLFTMEAKTEKCGFEEGEAFCVTPQRLTEECLVKPATEPCF